jgi:hypothetical protein
MSDFGDIQGPEADLFGSISAAYGEMDANGEFEHDDDAHPDTPDAGEGGMVEWDDSWDKDQPGITPEEEQEFYNQFPDPNNYQDNGRDDGDYDPLPEKEN